VEAIENVGVLIRTKLLGRPETHSVNLRNLSGVNRECRECIVERIEILGERNGLLTSLTETINVVTLPLSLVSRIEVGRTLEPRNIPELEGKGVQGAKNSSEDNSTIAIRTLLNPRLLAVITIRVNMVT